MEALGKAARLVGRHGREFGKRLPGLVRETTYDDLKSAEKRVEQMLDILTGKREDADQVAQSRRRLPLDPEAAHGSYFEALLRRAVFGQPSADASSSSSEDVADDPLARFGCRPILAERSRRKLSPGEIILSYERASNRLIVLTCDDSVITTKGFKGLMATNASPEWVQIVVQLCADARNTVFAVTEQKKSDVADWPGPAEDLGVSAEKGYFIRWSRNSQWEYQSGSGSTLEKLIQALGARGRVPDFILCLADDACEVCTVGDKPRLARYYLEHPSDLLELLQGLVEA